MVDGLVVVAAYLASIRVVCCVSVWILGAHVVAAFLSVQVGWFGELVVVEPKRCRAEQQLKVVVQALGWIVVGMGLVEIAVQQGHLLFWQVAGLAYAVCLVAA